MGNFDQIYEKNFQIVYRYLFSLTQDSDLSEELTQETFYQAVKSINRFDHSCKISTWLCAIAKKQLMKYQRKEKKFSLARDGNEVEGTPEHFLEAVGETISAENQFLANDNLVEILRRIHKIPEPGREVLYLRVFGCLSFRDIGDVMGKSENWARVTYYRVKLRLREVMKNEEHGNSAL